MPTKTRPPFRADHVGSLPRPEYVLDARDDKAAGKITPAELRKIEDRAIADVWIAGSKRPRPAVSSA